VLFAVVFVVTSVALSLSRKPLTDVDATKASEYDGKLKAFGMVYLPRRGKNANLRSYGFVANRALFKRMKNKWNCGFNDWKPIEFNDEMI
jgi:hypothetical protein